MSYLTGFKHRDDWWLSNLAESTVIGQDIREAMTVILDDAILDALHVDKGGFASATPGYSPLFRNVDRVLSERFVWVYETFRAVSLPNIP